MKVRGIRCWPGIPYVPDEKPEESVDPLLTDYIRRELEKIQDTLADVNRLISDLDERVKVLEP